MRRALLSRMSYCLPDHVSFGFVGERAVLLDLDADRYLLLGRAEAATLGALGTPGASAPSATILGRLIDRGLIRRGCGGITPIIADVPRSSALEANDTRGKLRISEVGIFRLGAGVSLRWRGLAATIARTRLIRARYAPRLDGKASDDDAAFAARGYAAARTYVPAAQRCVPDSLALARALWRRGIGADLYFGVRLDPFSAHSWVQRGDLLLSDGLGRVTDHVPVFRL